jgi:hypothetical protein
MAELDGRTTRLAVLLGVSVIVIAVAAAVPHHANEIGAVAIGIALFTICWLKGKRGFACLGLVIPFVWLTGAIRLAKPASYWAWHWYDGAKMTRAQQRYARPEQVLPGQS